MPFWPLIGRGTWKVRPCKELRHVTEIDRPFCIQAAPGRRAACTGDHRPAPVARFHRRLRGRLRGTGVRLPPSGPRPGCSARGGQQAPLDLRQLRYGTLGRSRRPRSGGPVRRHRPGHRPLARLEALLGASSIADPPENPSFEIGVGLPGCVFWLCPTRPAIPFHARPGVFAARWRERRIGLRN